MAVVRVGEEFTKALAEWASGLGRVAVDIGEAAVLHIRERTKSGLDKQGNALKHPYTRKYAQRKGQENVDLRLSGQMLGNLQVLEGAGSAKVDTTLGGSKVRETRSGQAMKARDTQISIGFSDPTQAIKAYAHISGNSPRWRNEHQRDFMGLEEQWVVENIDRSFREYGLPRATKQEIIIGK